MKDYLENGNINNSVNLPNCDMGVCHGPRVGIFHKNVANMIGQFTTVFGNMGMNISDMTNKSRGDYAYTLIDLEESVSAEIVKVKPFIFAIVHFPVRFSSSSIPSFFSVITVSHDINKK